MDDFFKFKHFLSHKDLINYQMNFIFISKLKFIITSNPRNKFQTFILNPMNKEIENGVQSVKKFAAESYRFLEVCEKPDVAGKSYFNFRIQKNRSIMRFRIRYYGRYRLRCQIVVHPH